MGIFDQLKKIVLGEEDKVKKSPSMAPYQQQAFQKMIENPIQNDHLYGAGANYYQRLLSNEPGAFSAYEAPSLRQFNEQIVPGLSERFSGGLGYGGTGAGGLLSSGFQNSLAQEAGSLAERLAAQRAGLQSQAAQGALQYAQQPYSNVFSQSQISPYNYSIQRGNEGLLQPLATGAGFALGGPLGGAAVGGLGGLLKKIMGSNIAGASATPQSQIGINGPAAGAYGR